MKINLGCASRLIDGYLNIDTDSLEEIQARYPNKTISSSLQFLQTNFFELNLKDYSVEEIRADSLIEHLSFKEEQKFFQSVLNF